MWIGLPALVAAVSNAGGLGILTGLTPGSPEKLRESESYAGRLTAALDLHSYVIDQLQVSGRSGGSPTSPCEYYHRRIFLLGVS